MTRKQKTKTLPLTPIMTMTEDQKIGRFQEMTESLSLWSFNDITWKIGRNCNHYRSGHYVGQSIMVSNDPYTFVFIDSDEIGEFDRLSL